MGTALVGYTGCVGSNLALAHNFSALYNSKNIEQAFGTAPDLLVFAGLSGDKSVANKNPGQDFNAIENAFANIQRIAPKKLVLISSNEVYLNNNGVDEDSFMETNGLTAYGLNRYHLEQWVAHSGLDYTIIRLPIAYGKNLRRNFIYDLINIVPPKLPAELFRKFTGQVPRLADYYTDLHNGFYGLQNTAPELRGIFVELSFSAVNFMDSRAILQFYDLTNLWRDIERVLGAGYPLVNLATEPISVADIYFRARGVPFQNELLARPPQTDIRSKYAPGGYWYDQGTLLSSIVDFIREKS
ncbi:hypothetical protein NO2_1151 [Candidatus Termititenax persephonae]|uniref:NAD-dependent epimerase/dehydratase domain-containing protein n=1 Tax=Candidatus Termititenax persephonae TaxID=2218525 RepID=A0A388TIM1_9BACT|nr:hypothetical protein NO2_1151 [Candidatus Termititenax persephonae]